MPDRIEVGMGKGMVARAPCVLCCSGVGSCAVLALYDNELRLGGLAHIMLPDSGKLNGYLPPYRCADTALALLMKELRTMKASPRHIVAKLAGGARMFASDKNPGPSIGEQNTASIKQILKRDLIPLAGESTGGSQGRTIEFHLNSGMVAVKATGRVLEEI